MDPKLVWGMAGQLQAEHGWATLEMRQLAWNWGRDRFDMRGSEGSRIVVMFVVVGVGGMEHIATCHERSLHQPETHSQMTQGLIHQLQVILLPPLIQAPTK